MIPGATEISPVFGFNLVIKKRLKETKDGRKWKYLTYATNLERQYIKRTIKDIPEEYKKRWRIENNFKSVEQNRARTGSRNHSIRVFMFFLSMTACNLWYTAVRKMNRVTGIKLEHHAKKNMTANVFLVLLVVLAKKIIKSAYRESKYSLQCVRQEYIFRFCLVCLVLPVKLILCSKIISNPNTPSSFLLHQCLYRIQALSKTRLQMYTGSALC